MVLDIKSNQDMIESIWEDVYRLYANIALFNIRDLSIYGVLFLWRGPRANSSYSKGAKFLKKESLPNKGFSLPDCDGKHLKVLSKINTNSGTVTLLLILGKHFDPLCPVILD